jgi:acetolactate synthase-1/3 small subunit
MRHVLSALVMNQPGVLAHISGMLASRAFNIESLAVGATENPELSRMTFVVNGDEKTLDQVRKQLEKIVTVVRVIDFSKQNFVERDLMLIKISTEGGKRSEVHELVDIFRARIVDVGPTPVMVGRVALLRSAACSDEHEGDDRPSAEPPPEATV